MKRKTLHELKRIEKEVYPRRFRALEDVHTLAGLRKYCEGEPHVLISPGHWYLLYTKEKEKDEDYSGEIVDLACIPPAPLAFLRRVYRHLAHEFAGQLVLIRAREKTSWPLVKTAERWGRLSVLPADTDVWNGERFYETLIRF